MVRFDDTHDPRRRSWVASANGHADFPLQNLPLGVISSPGDVSPRGGVAIGDSVLDLAAAHRAGLFVDEAGRAAELASGPRLNRLMAAGADARRALRRRLVEMLTEGAPERRALEPMLLLQSDCTMHLPAEIGDYTDFYAGIHHAMNVGRQFRPDNPLLPNYKYVPIGYHGRSSSIRPSGAVVRRPNGQRKAAGDAAAPPDFGPSRRLDYELELGIWIGPGNDLGTPIPIARGRGAHRRVLPAQRLVGARHPGLGVPAARPLPRQEFCDQHFTVGRHARGAGAVPDGAAAASRRRPGTARLPVRRARSE